jgi:hypothetical protein
VSQELVVPIVEDVDAAKDPFLEEDLREIREKTIRCIADTLPLYFFMFAPLAGAPHGGTEDGKQGCGKASPTGEVR